jgi:hypothetical protein
MHPIILILTTLGKSQFLPKINPKKLITAPLLHPTTAGYGRSPQSTQTNQATTRELQNSQNIANWSAQSAVATSVANDYANQLATTAQYTNQFTAPVTKEQTGQVLVSLFIIHRRII